MQKIGELEFEDTTLDGFPVKIYGYEPEWVFPIIGAYYKKGEWILSQWDHRGYMRIVGDDAGAHLDTRCRLVSHNLFADIKIDDPVFVWNAEGEEKTYHHFAGVDDEWRPLTYPNGRTSFSFQDPECECASCTKVVWKFCEKALLFS